MAEEEVSVDELKRAVEALHGGPANLVQVIPVPVDERGDDQPISHGLVHVFVVSGSPQRIYAWSSVGENGTRRFHAVPHKWPVSNPAEAVRAVIWAERKAKKGNKPKK